MGICSKNNKKAVKWMSLCCTEGYKWVTVMDGVRFEFNDIISLYTKNDSERIFYIYIGIIINTVAG